MNVSLDEARDDGASAGIDDFDGSVSTPTRVRSYRKNAPVTDDDITANDGFLGIASNDMAVGNDQISQDAPPSWEGSMSPRKASGSSFAKDVVRAMVPGTVEAKWMGISWANSAST
jgi:hypothetical protein